MHLCSFLADVIMNYLMCWSVLFAAQLNPAILEINGKSLHEHEDSTGWPKPEISTQLTVMTVKDQVELHCDLQHWYDECLINSSSQQRPFNEGQSKTKPCTVTVSGAQLLVPKAGYNTLIQISCGYSRNTTWRYSDNITVMVFNINLPMKYIVISVVGIGLTILLTLCILIWGCYTMLTASRNRAPPLPSQSYPTQQTDQQSKVAEGDKEVRQEPEDDLCYATVRYSSTVKRSPQVLRFEQNSEYASVIFN
ncbi:uncharacterized protein LOC122133323 isoform X2 [Clupea harengus]|uniref:Uncharacterized protein LOC122133323 isoform X2 n=1 Tax=Clupea harengus TaxID=7950 RepID=A0A8M1KMU3_CLUHA|nr:uncharacterized protein LOC122133323 isoform X2 [Clupea harengus]